MAQAKKRRRKKRRGTQAGTIDKRGALGRRPHSREEARAQARQRRAERFEHPPTLRSSSGRAAIAALIFFAFVLLVEKKLAASMVLGVLAFLIYVPISYWTDRFMYRRRQRKKAQQLRQGHE